MGDFYIKALAYSDIAKAKGEEAAQAMWETNGGTGRYVPGMTAMGALGIDDGLVIHGKTEPYKL